MKVAKQVEIECDECGSMFFKKESRLKYSKRHFCDVKCSDLYKRKSMKGDKNPSFGKSHTPAWKEARRVEMTDLWQREEYREKVLSSREKYNKREEYPYGWTPLSREKRRATVLELYGFPHNWSNKDCREKCEQTTLERHGLSSLELAQNQISKETIEKRRKTLIETMCGVTYEEYENRLSERDRYYKQVRRITEQQPLFLLENYERRAAAYHDEEAYHLDHIVPIVYGFYSDIPPDIIGDISNLRFIPYRENLSKSSKYDKEI